MLMLDEMLSSWKLQIQLHYEEPQNKEPVCDVQEL